MAVGRQPDRDLMIRSLIKIKKDINPYSLETKQEFLQLLWAGQAVGQADNISSSATDIFSIDF